LSNQKKRGKIGVKRAITLVMGLINLSKGKKLTH
jgi:hypothetical protein